MEEITNPFERESYLNRKNESNYYYPENDESYLNSNFIKKNIDENDNSIYDIDFVYYIFNSNSFTFNINISGNELAIKYENSQNDYKKIKKIKGNYEEKYKSTNFEEDLNLLDNLEKLLNFIESIKENLKKEFINEFYLKVNLKMKVNKNNEKESYKNTQNINCRYLIDNSNYNQDELFEDENILINGPGKAFENFLNKLKKKLKINLSTINQSIDKMNKSGLYDFINIVEYIDNITNSFDYTYNSLFSDQFHSSIINQFSEILKEQGNLNSVSNEQINRALIISNINEKSKSNINISHFLQEFTDANLSDIRNNIQSILKSSKITLDVSKINGQLILEYGRIIFDTGSIIYNEFLTPFLGMKDQKNENSLNNPLFINYIKLIEFLENIKEKIKTYYKREFNLKILFNFQESIEENEGNSIKNISCEYELMNLSIIDIDMKVYQDNNIFFNNNYKFQSLIDDINFINKTKKFIIIEFLKVIGKHNNTVEYIKELSNGIIISGGNDNKLFLYDSHEFFKKIGDIELINYCINELPRDNEIIKIMICSYKQFIIHEINPSIKITNIIGIQDIDGINFFIMKNNNYIICCKNEVYLINFNINNYLNIKKNIIIQKSYRGGIKISDEIIALTSNRVLSNGEDKLILYNLDLKKIIFEIVGYSFTLSKNNLFLMNIMSNTKNIKKTKLILLCACKKYLEKQNNGILLIIIENNSQKSYNFYDTGKFEVFCFCPIIVESIINYNIYNKNDEIENKNIDYILVGGFNKYKGEGLIKLYKLEYKEAIEKIKIEYLQDIIFNKIISKISQKAFIGFKNPISCIIQSRIKGNILISSFDGNVYLFSEPNIKGFEKLKKNIKNLNYKLNEFEVKPENLTLPENMKTLFAVDCSGSITGCEIYFKKLSDLKLKYYKSSRGDKFYTWGSNYYYKTESEMDSFIANKKGTDGTCSYYIAEIGRETKNENFEHLIIVTDGSVGTYDIDESDRRVVKYGLKYSFVSTYIIGSGGDESVGCPFRRNSPGVTYVIDNNGNETVRASLSKEDIDSLNKIDQINNRNDFESKYESLFNAIRAKTLGKYRDSDLKNKLNNLKARIADVGQEQDNIVNKFNILYDMVNERFPYVLAFGSKKK